MNRMGLMIQSKVIVTHFSLRPHSLRLSLVACGLLILWVCFQPVAAHEIRPASLQIQETAIGEYKASWKVPARNNTRLALHPMLDGEPLFEVQYTRFANGAFIETGAFSQPEGLGGRTLNIEGLTSTFTDVLLRLVLLDGSVMSVRLSPETPVYQFEEQITGSGVMMTYIELGVRHILFGIDHLLFVVCIMLIAGFTRKLVWAITGFSIAHSITLGVAALEIVVLPVPLIEAVIALSIVFMAAEILRGNTTTITHQYPVTVSLGFGLLHGFGFAAVLGEIGLPRGESLLALICFNIGVELGQLLFVAALFVTFQLVVKRLNLPLQSAKTLITYAMGGIASFWVFQRVALF